MEEVSESYKRAYLKKEKKELFGRFPTELRQIGSNANGTPRFIRTRTPDSLSDTTDNAVMHIQCEHCGHISVYLSSDRKPTTCNRCLKFFNNKPSLNKDVSLVSNTSSLKTILDNTENVSYDTHRQFRWVCYSCDHKGLKWLNKDDRFTHCPNCEHSGPDLHVDAIDPKGKCSSIWSNSRFEIPTQSAPKVPWKTSNCPECGSGHRYLIRPPHECHNCGRPWKNTEG
jgi:ribosomal protein S27E